MWKKIRERLQPGGPEPSRQDSPSLGRFQRNRRWLALLSTLGLADSAYLLLFQTGKVKHLWCPGLGKACDRIVSSPKAFQHGIPDAVFGVAGYAGLLAFIVKAGKQEDPGRSTAPLWVGGGALIGYGLSLWLTYVQKKEFDDVCVWCLVFAALCTLMVPLAMPEFLHALRAAPAPGAPQSKKMS